MVKKKTKEPKLPKISKDKIENIIDQLWKGKASREIAKTLGVDKKTVLKIAKVEQIPSRAIQKLVKIPKKTNPYIASTLKEALANRNRQAIQELLKIPTHKQIKQEIKEKLRHAGFYYYYEIWVGDGSPPFPAEGSKEAQDRNCKWEARYEFKGLKRPTKRDLKAFEGLKREELTDWLFVTRNYGHVYSKGK